MTDKFEHRNWGVMVKVPGRKHFQMYGSKGHLVKLKIHCALYTKETAEEVARDIAQTNPGFETKAKQIYGEK